MRKISTHRLTQAAMIAALYAALTYASAAAGLAYGEVQFRLSEALTILPVFTPVAPFGLAVGCFLGNIGSPYGLVDLIGGTLTTFAAAWMTHALRHVRVRGMPVLSMLPPVLMNAALVGGQVALFTPESGWQAFWFSAAWVAVEEIAMCCILGGLLYLLIRKHAMRLFP